jgi:hypothetical protein
VRRETETERQRERERDRDVMLPTRVLDQILTGSRKAPCKATETPEAETETENRMRKRMNFLILTICLAASITFDSQSRYFGDYR